MQVLARSMRAVCWSGPPRHKSKAPLPGGRGSRRKKGLDDFHRALGQRIEEGLAVFLEQDAVVQHDDNAGVGLGADEPADSLTARRRFSCQNRPVMCEIALGTVSRTTAIAMKTDKAEDFLPTRRSLLTRLKDWDDQTGWKRFHTTYWKLIYGVAIKSGLTHAEAEDVAQETVVSVAKKMKYFKYDPALGSFKGWLRTLTARRIVDHFRKRQRNAANPAPQAEDTSCTPTIERIPDPETLCPDRMWEEEWQKNLMDAALKKVKGKVNAKDYQIFHLYVVKELSVADVMEALNVSKDQVYQAKSRILPLLEKEIERLKTELL